MPTAIRPVRLNHMNVVLEDFDASLAHFRALYDAEFVLDIPQPEMHAGLVAIGGVITELFTPRVWLLNARYGPHHLGVEYQADMDQVRAAVADHGLRIVRDIGMALHTHPADGFGVAFEFYAGEFHEQEWPLLGGRLKPAAWWRDEHPLGLTGLKGYTLAVWDLAAATTFLQSFLGARPVFEAERPAMGARAVGLQVADDVVEVLAPAGDGGLREHLIRHGEGIRSTVYGVRSLAQAQAYFAARGVPVEVGSATNVLAVPAAANRGVIFEFSE